MRSTTEIALAVEAWAAETCDINHYEHAPPSLDQAFPLVVSEVQSDEILETQQPGIPAGYQQTYLRVWVVQLMLLVHPGSTSDETWTASQQLYGYVDALGAALRADKTLGQRVEAASELYTASYEPPEVEYADGTVARTATFRVNVGEQTGGV